MMERVYIDREDDRLTVAAILIKNRYTVRQGSRQRKGSKARDYYIELEPNAENKQATYDAAETAALLASQPVLEAAT